MEQLLNPHSLEHPLVAIIFRNIGNALNGLERYEEALGKYQAALDIQQRMLLEDHPETAKTRKLIQTCREKMAKDKNTKQ